MNKNISIISMAALIIFSLTACVDDYDEPPVNRVPEDMKLNVENMYEIYQDSGDNYTFEEDYMLYATVIMDDSKGNIYKEAYVQDSTAGINLYRLSSPGLMVQGDQVRVNLNDVSIVYYNGKMELVFDNILNAEEHIIVQASDREITPYQATLTDILDGTYDSELVTISDVQFADSELGKTYANINGSSAQNRTLENCDGESIIVRTSDYSDFAGDTIPEGNGQITGVITKYSYPDSPDVIWQLLIRDTDEVLLDGPRCDERK
ncbi:MAG: DUF5689 domain-containing protein [Bacteroidales bacterium]